MSITDLIGFKYEATSRTGETTKGVMQATSLEGAVGKLRAKGLIPVTVKPAKGTLTTTSPSKRVKLKGLAVSVRQLATLVRSGVTLLRAIDIVAQQTEDAGLRTSFEAMAREVERGVSLSDALENQAKFPPLLVSLVRVGEEGGFLDSALDSAAATIGAELKLRQKIVSAMAYPVVVLGVAVLSVIAMLLFVVPVFSEMFASFGADLPLPTQILVTLSETAIIWLPLLVGSVVGGIFWWRANKNNDKVRKVFHTWLMRMPIVGPLSTKIAIARFSRNLATMLGAGVQMLQAIQTVGMVANNWVIEEALRSAEPGLRFGKGLGEQLSKHPVFPPMVTQMISVGESSGALEQMLTSVAGFYDTEVEATTDSLTSIIEPLLIVFIGVVIGGMVVALYLPVFMMSSVIAG